MYEMWRKYFVNGVEVFELNFRSIGKIATFNYHVNGEVMSWGVISA